MNPPYSSLPTSATPVIVISVILAMLGVLCLFYLFIAFLVRTATTWVAGFTPSWGRACGAILFAGILSFIANLAIANLLGAKSGHPNPLMGLWSLPISFLVNFLIQAITYQSILRGEDEEGQELTFPKAVLVVLVQAVLSIVVAVVLGFCVMLAGLPGLVQLKQLQARYGGRGAGWPTELPQPSSPSAYTPPAFATVADAQKEAVRRYPMLGVNGSRMNKAFVERYRLYQQTKPDFFLATSWPLTLAEEVAKDPAAK